jgi:hypothetical protein
MLRTGGNYDVYEEIEIRQIRVLRFLIHFD